MNNLIKNFLASANTGEGFVQYFDYINDGTRDGFTFVLKGAPGSGKSTLMRKVGNHFYKKGYNIEFFHCSSDIASLDGVRVAELNIAVVDGTAPHVREAPIPLVDGKIVNLCGYAGETEIKKQKSEIIELLAKKQACFETAYSLIAASKKIEDASRFFESGGAFSRDKILSELSLKEKNAEKISNRKLFAGAVTGEGLTNVMTNESYSEIISAGASDEDIADLVKSINALGYTAVLIMNPLSPRQCEHIAVEGTDKMVTFVRELSREGAELTVERDNILKRAGKYLDEAKEYHREIEKFYSQNMDFDGLDMCCKDIINQIENMEL